jgi:dihydrofolate reductase
MSKVVFDTSMSLDGFMTAASQTPEEPLGKDGLQLHAWAFGDNADAVGRKIIEEGIASIGAVIAGRKTYDTSLPGWGADGPTGPARRPVFVVTHNVPAESPEGGVYTFMTDGIEDALAHARAVAGEKDISVMGGASIGQHYLAAGLVDEISIHLAPVLFGSGTRMFEHLADEHTQLELVDTVATPVATHLRYRIVK